jgi:adenine phosphoribosyltransferase
MPTRSKLAKPRVAKAKPTTGNLAKRKAVQESAQKPAQKKLTAKRSKRSAKGAKPEKKQSASGLSQHALNDRFNPLGYAKRRVRAIADFPIPGILFRDITPVLADARAFHAVIDAFVARFVGERLDAIVAIESRGFIFGAALAARLNVSFVPVRRPGKLPAATDRVRYKLEYGTAELEMHKDALPKGARVVVIDDLLATGGTAKAASKLVKQRGASVVAYAFVIELSGLPGRAALGNIPVVSLIRY